MAKVTAAIILYNRAQYIGVLLESLFDSEREGLDVQAVVVDNGSQDDGAEVAESFGDKVEVIRNETNQPLAVAFNQALDAAINTPGTEYIMLLNDDVSLLPGCLDRLVEVAEEHPHSLITPLQLEYDPPHDIDSGALEPILRMQSMLEDAILREELKPAYETDHLVGAALLATRDAFMNIGRFDELYAFYGLDTDYNNRAKYLGYKLLLVPKARALHAHGRFLHKQEQADKSDFLRRWRTMLISRYLFRLKNPDYPLAVNYALTLVDTGRGLWECCQRLWIRGMYYTIATQLQMFARYPEVRAARRRDFDPSRRIEAS